MFCSKCGHQLPDGGAFCPNCGNPTNITAGQSGQPLQSQSPFQAQGQPSYKAPQGGYQQSFTQKQSTTNISPAKRNYYIWAGSGVLGLLLLLMPFISTYFVSYSGYALLDSLNSIGESGSLSSILIILMILDSIAIGVTGVLLASENSIIKKHIIQPLLVGEAAVYTAASVITAIIIISVSYGVSPGIGAWISVILGIAQLIFFFLVIKKHLPVKASASYGQPQAFVHPQVQPFVQPDAQPFVQPDAQPFVQTEAQPEFQPETYTPVTPVEESAKEPVKSTLHEAEITSDQTTEQ